MAICPVALTTGLFPGRSCCDKHTTIPMPWDTADHVQDLCSFSMHLLRSISQRTESAKKEIRFMSGTTATEVLLLRIGATAFDLFLAFVNFPQLGRAEQFRRCFPQYADRACQDVRVVTCA